MLKKTWFVKPFQFTIFHLPFHTLDVLTIMLPHIMLILSSRTLHVSLCVVSGYKSFSTHSTVIYIILNNPFTVSLWMVPWYYFPSKQCIGIQIFSTMTLQVAPGDGLFGTQITLIWIFHSMNLYVALGVVCGCIVFANNIPNIYLIIKNNMSLWNISHVAFHVTFFALFIVLHVFFLQTWLQ